MPAEPAPDMVPVTPQAAGRIEAALARMGPVLGIDAGVPGTRAVLVTGGIPRRGPASGPFNFLLHDDGVPRMAALVRAARPAAAGIGVPGIPRQPGAARAFAAAVSAAWGGLPRPGAPGAV